MSKYISKVDKLMFIYLSPKEYDVGSSAAWVAFFRDQIAHYPLIVGCARGLIVYNRLRIIARGLIVYNR